MYGSASRTRCAPLCVRDDLKLALSTSVPRIEALVVPIALSLLMSSLLDATMIHDHSNRATTNVVHQLTGRFFTFLSIVVCIVCFVFRIKTH